MRGNLFPNTHDILPYILQEGGRPAFKMRFALAATLSSVYGIYSGYELCEATPVAGREEYLFSEKYQYKVWDWDRPGNIIDYITRINQIRREHPALQEYTNLRFFNTDHESVLAYGKTTPNHDDTVVVVVNLDPFNAHEATVDLPTHLWNGSQHRLWLDPHHEPALFFALNPWERVDYVEGCG
jgi:starch synthase (maltosyl-transferring)